MAHTADTIAYKAAVATIARVLMRDAYQALAADKEGPRPIAKADVIELAQGFSEGLGDAITRAMHKTSLREVQS